MLAKLFKHEIKDLFKKSILFFGIVAGLTVLVYIFDSFKDSNVAIFFASGLLKIGYGISIVGIIIYSIVYPLIRYHKSMLKDEAYLTHTLPVSKAQLLFVKVSTALILYFLTLIVILLSFLLTNPSYVKNIINSLHKAVNHSIFAFLFIFLAFSLYYLSIIMLVITALTIGYSKSRKKIGNSILTGIVIYFIYQFIGLITLIIIVFIFSISFQNIESFTSQFYALIYTPIVLYLIAVTVEFFITHYFLKNKLNLE